MEARLVMGDPAASLTDDLFVKILARLPVKSLCRCKCVSRPWRQLISHPDHRKKLPQTLAGFFYRSISAAERWLYPGIQFASVAGKDIPCIDPSFSFSPGGNVVPLDSCNGLLLYRCYQPGGGQGIKPYHYAGCNPATKKLVTLPDGAGDGKDRTARLCFDPTVSSHFHVVEYVGNPTDCCLAGVQIYSSETAAWNFKKCGWGDDLMLIGLPSTSVFLNGFLHAVVGWGTSKIVAVDMKGESWRTISTPPEAMPEDVFSHIHKTQDLLCLTSFRDDDAYKLSIWILDDYGTEEWTLQHTISTWRLSGLLVGIWFKSIAVHPDCSLIYFVYGKDNTLMAYVIDHREARVICNLGDGFLQLYVPYVPLFEESLAEKN
ncbi:hypothetical protein ACP70R_028992 [Stipagrostis hirtigluma subsp. patula]